MALETCYQRYKNQAEFFFVHQARRDPAGFWINLSDRSEMLDRAVQAATCPSAVGVTIPRLLDDTAGTADFLYRADPFRVCIVDLDGRIAYHSPDGATDYESETLDQLIGQQLERLLANRGRVTAEMRQQARCDEAGKPAVGFWLPRMEYFAQETAVKPAVKQGKKTPARVEMVEILDARGYVTKVAKDVRTEMERRRTLVTRLFCTGETPSSRPVVLIFAGGAHLALPTRVTAIENFYTQYQQEADIFLIYTGHTPGGRVPGMSGRAMAAQAAFAFGRRTIPLLLDDLENDIAVAYGAESDLRLCVIARDPVQGAVVRYTSPATNATFDTVLAEAARQVEALRAH